MTLKQGDRPARQRPRACDSARSSATAPALTTVRSRYIMWQLYKLGRLAPPSGKLAHITAHYVKLVTRPLPAVLPQGVSSWCHSLRSIRQASVHGRNTQLWSLPFVRAGARAPLCSVARGHSFGKSTQKNNHSQLPPNSARMMMF